MSDTNLISRWRLALVDVLQTAFPEADVDSGEQAGLSRNKDRIRVFWPGFSEAAGDVNFANPTMTIRYWKKRSKAKLADVPHDEAPLEQAAVDLMEALEAVQAAILDEEPRILFRVTNVRPVRDEYAIEAFLFAWARNPATTPGG